MAETFKKIQELIEQNKILEKRNEELKNIIDINLSQPGLEPEIPLKELIANTEIESLVFKFYHTWKISTAIFNDTAEVLFSIGWKKLFSSSTGMDDKVSCIQDILKNINQNSFEKKFYKQKCSNGLNTIAFPIEIKKGYKALLVLTHFFNKNEIPVHDTFAQFAKENNIDEKELLQQLSEIPVFSAEEMDKIINQGIILTDMISFIGTKNYEFFKRFRQQTDNNTLLNSLRKKITEQETLIKTLLQNIREHQQYIEENTINKSVVKKETNKITQKLIRTETILNSILTSSPLGICFIKAGVITFANNQIFRLTGYTAKEIIGRLLDYILPENSTWEKIIERSNSAILKEHTTFLSQIKRKDGELMDITGFLAKIHQDNSNEEYILSILNFEGEFSTYYDRSDDSSNILKK